MRNRTDTTAPNSFRNWLRQEIRQVLRRKSARPPLLIWCDPERVWRDLLVAATEGEDFELWADEQHELLLRERFYKEAQKPRVIWMPTSREAITYFKVFELQAEEVKEITLIDALAQFGVDIPPDHRAELKPLLPAHSKEWLDRPKTAWRELTYGTAKDTLIDDERILRLLVGIEGFDSLKEDNRFGVFARRVTEDLGLPAPEEKDVQAWRIKAMAVLLVTEAADKVIAEPPSDSDHVIPRGACRQNALKLLGRLQKQIDMVDHFESLAMTADATTSLQYWAKSLSRIPEPMSAPVVERTLFDAETERLNKLDVFAELARHLDDTSSIYHAHSRSFWGKQAKAKVRWEYLVDLSFIAGLLHQQDQRETQWKAAKDAVEWFVKTGWQVDQAGEILFQDDTEFPGALLKVRARLRKAYMQKVADVNRAFSELLAGIDPKSGLHKMLELQYVGDAIQGTIEKASPKDPVAVVVLDACRYDLGCRLAELLNQGEPTRRAIVSSAMAPLPAITALGMPFLLPGLPGKLQVDVSEDASVPWLVTTDGFEGNLTQAERRRQWLKRTFKLKDNAFLTMNTVADTETPEALSVKSLGRLVFVFSDEFDDHDGKMKPFGFDKTLDRYARGIRRLRAGGYSTILVVTDHGFFHWEPETDEVEAKPDGDMIWSSRRAIVGRQLKHSTALAFTVPGSVLECRVPRSVDSFKTYGGLGFFHGGATLQELVIPIVTVKWPKKARKVQVVLKPITQITSVEPKVEVSPGTVQHEMFSDVDENLMARQVMVKVMHVNSGKLLFKSKVAVTVEPGGGTLVISLCRVEGTSALLEDEVTVQIHDADDEELLDRNVAKVNIELDEWF